MAHAPAEPNAELLQHDPAPEQHPVEAEGMGADEFREDGGTVENQNLRLDTSNASSRRSDRRSARTERYRRRAADRERAEQDRLLKEAKIRDMRRRAEANDAIIEAEQAALAAAQAAERIKRKAADMEDVAREEEELRELDATAAVQDMDRRMAEHADSIYEDEETLSESEYDAQYRALEEKCRQERDGPARQRADPVVGPAPQGKALIPATALLESGRTRSPSPVKHHRPHHRDAVLPRHSSPADVRTLQPSANRQQEPRRPRAGSQRNPESGLPSRADPEVGLARHLPDSGSRKLPSGLSQRTSQERSREQRECSQTEGLLRALRMPLIEITRFSGNPLEFANFMADFEESIEPGCTTDSERLSRLYHYCEGEAKEVVRSFRADRHNPDSYMAAKQRLQDLYGRNSHVAQQWVDRLLAMRVTSIRDMALQARNGLSALRQLGGEQEMDATVHMRALVARLPSYLQTRWRRKVVDIEEWSETPRFADLVAFLERAAQEEHHPTYGKGSGSATSRTATGNNFAIATEEPTPEECALCQGEHETSLCSDLVNATIAQRRELVTERKLCFSCLGGGHWARGCRAGLKCEVVRCGRRHHTLLHPSEPAGQNPGRNRPRQHRRGQESSGGGPPRMTRGPGGQSTQTAPPPPATDLQSSQGEPGHSSGAIATGGSEEDNIVTRTALPIVPVRVSAPGSSKEVVTYALLDSGSTITCCDDRLLNKLGVEGKRENLRLTTLGRTSTEACRVTTLTVTPAGGGGALQLRNVHAMGSLPIKKSSVAAPRDVSKWRHLQDLPISKPRESDTAMLLVGMDAPEALMPLQVRPGQPGEPYGVRTSLGWTVAGPIPGEAAPAGESCGLIMVNGEDETTIDTGMERQLERFWALEDGGLFSVNKGRSPKDDEVQKLWEAQIRTVGGHFQLPIPFRKRNPQLPRPRAMAERRLRSLRGKLERQPNLGRQYREEMDKLLVKGYAVKVPADQLGRDDGRVWYLPHHPVVNPNKEKPRVVFDCAAQHRGTSLNDAVYSGPDLTNSLVGVLSRFRLNPVAFMGDIEAMFHQVKVAPEDQDVLRFLWWPKGNLKAEPEDYRMTVHLFGGTWSPSCCAYALRRAAQDQPGFSEAARRTIADNFYVDDLLKSTRNPAEAKALIKDITLLLARSGFHITKWVSNSPEVMACIPRDQRSKKARERDLEEPLEERALGVYWLVEADAFSFRVRQLNKELTKRGLLSMLSSVYDPLGFASPFILKAKQIVQDLCRLQVGWDDPISECHRRKWEEWTKALPAMGEMRIPRCLEPRQGCGEIASQALHHFSDASEVAYGVVSYLRTEYKDGTVTTALAMAKSRLAPLKTQTIPRLELCAATLATRQDELLTRELQLDLDTPRFWTDSTIVLQYINNEERRFQVFVANRVSEIRSKTATVQWRHVPTELNPADDTSRGALPSTLTSDRWLEGPPFLKLSRNQWPTPARVAAVDPGDAEVRREATCLAVAQEAKPDPIDVIIGRYSSWTRMLRGVGRILQLQDLVRGNAEPGGPLTPEILRRAETAVIRHVQQQRYGEEMVALRDHGRVSKSSPLARLSPQFEDGLIRLTGRLRHAPVPEDTKCPAVLPNDHHGVKLLVRHIHEINGHAGRDFVLAEVRRQYWVVGATSVVQSVVRSCVTCRRREAPPCQQQMAELPPDRVSAEGPAFTNVGVDYFGPFLVKRGRAREKRYGCLFTCLVSRAVHVEVAESLSTGSFLNALYRFMARRGKPRAIISDNGRNFVGAERELRHIVADLDNSGTRDRLADRGISWTFNPPHASHMGGVWERQIRTVRRVFAGLTREQVMGDESLRTLLTIAEGIINDRPITPSSSDPDSLEALTPNHLLLMRPASLPRVPVGEGERLRIAWKQVQYMADVFWKRWVREYVPMLVRRTKWSQPSANVSPGDIVLQVDDLTPRGQWRLAKVTETFPGEDGLVRTAKIWTGEAELIRPVSKLCLMEASA